MAYSRSAASLTAANIFSNTPALIQSLYLLKIVFHFQNSTGKSRHGLPVREIQSTASTNNQLFVPVLPLSVILPRWLCVSGILVAIQCFNLVTGIYNIELLKNDL